VTGRLRELARAMLWHRRLLAAGLAAAAVAAALSVLAPDPPATVQVVGAARDLRGGAPLRLDDLMSVALAPSSVPAGALTDRSSVVGRVLAGPVRRGEPLTDVRLLGRELLGGYAGAGDRLVAAPVRLADAGAAALLRPGDVVDVLAAYPEQAGDAATVVATAVRVLSVPRLGDGDGASGGDSGDGLGGPGDGGLSSLGGAGFADGALIVLATTPTAAGRLAHAAASARLSITLRSE
jgi:Flp pilus assembly protein CpaB